MCGSLTEIRIPEGVTTIGSSAFSGCASLKTVYLPSTLEEIDIFAFNSCDSLKDIYFAGTEDAWSALTETALEGIPDAVSIHFAEA